MNRGTFFWLLSVAIAAALLVTPATHDPIIAATKVHPLCMGFIKFAILATIGEFLGVRVGSGEWKKPVGLIWRALVWGILGAMIAMAFQVYYAGAIAVMSNGLLPGKDSAYHFYITAFWTSFLMNATFGPMMMTAHRFSDAYIDLVGGKVLTRHATFAEVVARIDWRQFYGFVIGITCPFVWLPLHALTFMAPPEYRVLIAAILSVLFGALLAFAARRKKGLKDSVSTKHQKEYA